MLSVDKELIESELKKKAIVLQDKELSFFTNNCMIIATQSSLLTGFSYQAVMRVGFTGVYADSWTLSFFYYMASGVAMGSMISTLLISMLCSMYGPGLALQGPQGSHDVAVETLRHESVLIFVAFGLSLVSMIVCACAMAVIAFGPGAAAACAVFMTSLLAQAWRLCVLTSELKANHRFLQQSWHVKTKEGADFDLAKTVLT